MRVYMYACTHMEDGGGMGVGAGGGGGGGLPFNVSSVSEYKLNGEPQGLLDVVDWCALNVVTLTAYILSLHACSM